MTTFFSKPNRSDGRGLSQDLWAKCPIPEIVYNPGAGTFFYDDFIEGGAALSSNAVVMPRWSGYADTGSTVTGLGSAAWTAADAGGVLRLDTDTTDNDLIVLQTGGATGGGAAFGISDTAADKSELWFEARFRIDDVTTSSMPNFFVGLMAPNLSDSDDEVIADSGAIAQVAHLGFFRPEGDPNGLDVVYGAASQTVQTHADAWATLAADTWVRAGFYHNGSSIVPYLNGVAYPANRITSTNIAAATFPDAERMTPTIFMKNGTTTGGILDVDWIAVAQKWESTTT